MTKSDDEKKFNELMAAQDAKRAELDKDMAEIKERLRKMSLTPYAFSELDKYLKLEAWDWKDALLLLAGASPIGADVNWEGYYNYCDVLIKNPEIVNIGFIDCRLPAYDVPNDYSYGEDKNYFKGDKTIEEKIYQLRALQSSLGELYTFWINTIEPQRERNSPSYYIEWALSKSFHIEWLDFAIEQGFYVPKNEAVNKQVAEKLLNKKATHANISDNLAILTQASTKFWANADPKDNATHPLNSDVAAWLIERGYTQTLADKGATIIRPVWATTGRKAEK